jgi:hypothetical protein
MCQSLSSSLAQDTGLSRRRHGFKSRWGRFVRARSDFLVSPLLFFASRSPRFQGLIVVALGLRWEQGAPRSARIILQTHRVRADHLAKSERVTDTYSVLLGQKKTDFAVISFVRTPEVLLDWSHTVISGLILIGCPMSRMTQFAYNSASFDLAAAFGSESWIYFLLTLLANLFGRRRVAGVTDSQCIGIYNSLNNTNKPTIGISGETLFGRALYMMKPICIRCDFATPA